MSIPFANFDQTSPLSSSPHDPMLSLASNCIRDYFGPTVQMVADALMFRGEPITFPMLVATLRQKCQQRVYSEERKRLLGHKVAARLQNQTLQTPPLRAALLVMIQHDIVKVKMTTTTTNNNNNSNKPYNSTTKTVFRYHLDLIRARVLPRYPRYVEYTKKAVGDNAAALVEEILVQGQVRTVDAIRKTLERLQSLELLELEQQQQQEEAAQEANEQTAAATNNGASDVAVKTEDEIPPVTSTSSHNITTTTTTSTSNNKNSQMVQVVEAMKRLAQTGFLERVSPLVDESKKDDDDDDAGEFMFDEANNDPEPPKKKVKLQNADADHTTLPVGDEDPTIVDLLNQKLYKSALPRNAVWRVNVEMFHDSLRAFCLGRLAAERYGHKVQSAGSMVSAALKYLAHQKHCGRDMTDHVTRLATEELTFDAASIIRYLPKPVVQLLEKKRKAAAASNKTLSVVSQVAKSLQQLSRYTSPVCVLQVETSGAATPEDSKFEISTMRMVLYLQERIMNQMIADQHGEVAARIVTILMLNGHLESDSLAEAAMVPAKDIREVSCLNIV